DGRADAPRSHATDPTGGSRATATRSFARRSLTMYRGFLDRMADHGTVELRVDGVLQIATNDSEAESLRCRIGERAVWMDARQVLEMEPALRGAVGGLLHSEEGAVDNVALLATLARFIARELSAIHRVNAAAV